VLCLLQAALRGFEEKRSRLGRPPAEWSSLRPAGCWWEGQSVDWPCRSPELGMVGSWALEAGFLQSLAAEATAVGGVAGPGVGAGQAKADVHCSSHESESLGGQKQSTHRVVVLWKVMPRWYSALYPRGLGWNKHFFMSCPHASDVETEGDSPQITRSTRRG